LDVLLAGAELREGRAHGQAAAACGGAAAGVEETDEFVELAVEDRGAFGRRGNGLHQPGARLDEDQFAAGRLGVGREGVEDEIGGELDEVAGKLRLELGLGSRERAGDCLEFAEAHAAGGEGRYWSIRPERRNVQLRYV
jgi:hypothetical protein